MDNLEHAIRVYKMQVAKNPEYWEETSKGYWEQVISDCTKKGYWEQVISDCTKKGYWEQVISESKQPTKAP